MKTRKNFGSKNRSLRLEPLEQRTLLSVVLFQDDFSTDQGWTYGPIWERGSATESTGHDWGYPDPAADHTATGDNYIIGANIGGNVGYPVEGEHDYYYVVSPGIDCADIQSGERLILSFERHLNSWLDGHRVDVWSGSWKEIFLTEGLGTVEQQTRSDSQWNFKSYDVTSYANSNFKIRFGYSAELYNGDWNRTYSGWNIDDVKLERTPSGSTTPWNTVYIGGGSVMRQLQDVDGDGYVDSITNTRWYKNPGNGGGSWANYSIGNTDYPSAGCSRVGDVNGDGLPDLVIGVGRQYSSPDRNRIYAFINPGNTGTWTRYHMGAGQGLQPETAISSRRGVNYNVVRRIFVSIRKPEKQGSELWPITINLLPRSASSCWKS